MYDEVYEALRSEVENEDREARETQHYDHDEHEPTTFERAQYNEEVEQDIYERDIKLGAI